MLKEHDSIRCYSINNNKEKKEIWIPYPLFLSTFNYKIFLNASHISNLWHKLSEPGFQQFSSYRLNLEVT